MDGNWREVLDSYLEFVTEFYPSSIKKLPLFFVHFSETFCHLPSDSFSTKVCSSDIPLLSVSLESHAKSESVTSSRSTLNVFLTNARSLCSKMDVLRARVLLHNPGVICITESWGNYHIPDSSFHIDGYNLYRCDREVGRGGGVLI